ncbi:hypothetical protein E2562_033440 [Oryza meyeriana var. granulata]|uniref:Uncharacterized protein n=1 Tax=Oryza meyeriana var. granulata TaxID=110450 RepID=A0A6G1E5Y6_9ORYZ|nr:hypothetical protein E2562_033440 [Oryza meyeriana var. granulata]
MRFWSRGGRQGEPNPSRDIHGVGLLVQFHTAHVKAINCPSSSPLCRSHFFPFAACECQQTLPSPPRRRDLLMPLTLVRDASPSPLQRNRPSGRQMSGAVHLPSRASSPLKRSALATPVALAFLLIFAAGVFLYSGTTTPSRAVTSAGRVSEAGGSGQALLSPTLGSIGGARAIWELPATPARAVLFVAHGCHCRPANFWPPSPRCPGCVGLPEDVSITERALRRRFAVLSLASARECWSMGQEVSAAKRGIQSWTAENGLGDLPVAALGASSGGYFVSWLAAEMRLAAVVLMIAEGSFGPNGVPAGYPPAMFLHMPKDQRRAVLVERNSKMLRRNGVEVKELQSLELPLTPTMLSDRIPRLNQGLSERIWRVFTDEGFVDERGYMRKDGRTTPWKDAVVKRGFWEEVSGLAEHIQEELNLAYGYHEMTSLHTDEMFDWIEEHLS